MRLFASVRDFSAVVSLGVAVNISHDVYRFDSKHYFIGFLKLYLHHSLRSPSKYYTNRLTDCKEIEPAYLELAQAYQNDDIIIAKCDSYTNKEIGDRYAIQSWPNFKFFDGRGGEPIDYGNAGWDMTWWSKFIKERTGIRPSDRSSRPTPQPSNSASPPPVPMASRPNLAGLQRSKPKVAAVGTAAGVCLKCRDFSGPDNHAARFPRQSIPSTDTTWLAHQLCDPFPSATDKARAIFTWLHHNIEYNTVAFFSNNVKSSTPAGTMATGLAVCEGYAALFTALATPAGLESVVIGGHGKGVYFLSLSLSFIFICIY
jgi:thiol-disulfide isomerase/thioredoxin